jgi:hypothetical protein
LRNSLSSSTERGTPLFSRGTQSAHSASTGKPAELETFTWATGRVPDVKGKADGVETTIAREELALII